MPAELTDDVFVNRLHDIAGLLVAYFSSGQGAQVIARRTEELRRIAYKAASPWDLLQVDIATALIQMRLRTSAWMNLPGFMGLPEADLTATIRKEGLINDQISVFDYDRPLHVSYSVSPAAQVTVMRRTAQGNLVPKTLDSGQFLKLK